jgi:hypothetical protein
MHLVWIKTGWCSSRGSIFEPAKRRFIVNSGLIFEASDDDLGGIKNKHEGGLRDSYGRIGNGNAVGLDQNGWCSSRGNVFEPAKRGFYNVNSGLIFEASDDDLVGMCLRKSYGRTV